MVRHQPGSTSISSETQFGALQRNCIRMFGVPESGLCVVTATLFPRFAYVLVHATLLLTIMPRCLAKSIKHDDQRLHRGRPRRSPSLLVCLS